MEPFYQLNNPKGRTAKDPLLLSYPEATLSKVLYQSFVSKHWLSFFGSVNMVLVTVCTLLASETVFLTTVGDTCYVIVDATSDVNEECHLLLVMRPVLGWAVAIVLVFVFVMTICIIVRLRRRKSGIYADPTTIAGIACLLSDDPEKKLLQSTRLQSEKYTLIPSGHTAKHTVVEIADHHQTNNLGHNCRLQVDMATQQCDPRH